MFKNYWKIALRNIKRHKVYSLLNTAGLAIGIAACILVALFIENELSFDQFHVELDNLYRVNSVFKGEGGIHRQAVTQAPLGPAMKADLAEVKAITRFLHWSTLVKCRDNVMKERLTYADQDILKMFSFPLLQGNPDLVLEQKNSVVISAKTAAKYFGEDDAMGKSIAIEIDGNYEDFVVVGVAAEVPSNSSIKFDILVPFEKLKDFVRESYFSGWGSFTLRTFVQLNEGVTSESVNAKMSVFISKYIDDSSAKYILQPLKSIHLGCNVVAGMSETGNVVYSYILAGVAFLILFIACINFMNISVAQSSIRQKEIGLRKVIGATRTQLMGQFWLEALIMSAISFAIGLLFTELSLPLFNSLTGKSLSLDYMGNALIIPALVALVVIVGLISGTYPALFLSKFSPGETLKGTGKIKHKNSFTRALVVFQFVISTFLIIATIVIISQIDYMKNKNLGFNIDRIVVLQMDGTGGQSDFDNLKNLLEQQNGILSIAGANSYPGGGFNGTGVETLNGSYNVNIARIDYDFLELYGMKLKHGRGFSKEISSDEIHSVIINETLYKDLGWESPDKEQLTVNWGGVKNANVIGVVEDFNFTSLHDDIEPLVFYVNPEITLDYMFLKLETGDIVGTMARIKDTWQKVVPQAPFEYFFLQDEFNELYKTEEQCGRMMKYSSMLAIIIACFGIFGLSALLITKRTKEIGLRKLLGSSVIELVVLLSKDFSKWVILANIIAWPVSWYLLNKWLQNFSNSISMTIWPFLFSGLTVLSIALLTVSFQAVKAARSNPVNALNQKVL